MFSLRDHSNAAINENGSISRVDAEEVIANITANWARKDCISLIELFEDLPPAMKRVAAAHRASKH
jgi:hypothetical protein